MDFGIARFLCILTLKVTHLNFFDKPYKLDF